MRLGISSATFFLKEQTEDTFDLMRQLRLDLCEVFLTTFSEYESCFSQILKERKGSIDVHSIHAYSTAIEPQLFNLAVRTREDGEYYFKKVLIAAQTLGAKFYTFHGQPRMKKYAKFDLDWVGERVQQLSEKAIKYDIELCFENVHWAHFNHPDFFAQIKERSKDVKACLDIKQALQSGVDYSEYLAVMQDRLRTVHISDYDEMGKTCLIGEGVFDFDLLIKRLLDIGYGGPLIIEQYAKDYHNYTHLRQGVEHIRAILSKYF